MKSKHSDFSKSDKRIGQQKERLVMHGTKRLVKTTRHSFKKVTQWNAQTREFAITALLLPALKVLVQLERLRLITSEEVSRLSIVSSCPDLRVTSVFSKTKSASSSPKFSERLYKTLVSHNLAFSQLKNVGNLSVRNLRKQSNRGTSKGNKSVSLPCNKRNSESLKH